MSAPPLLAITLTETQRGLFCVESAGLFAGQLTRDEALGAIASALFGPADAAPMFLHTYAQWHVRRHLWNDPPAHVLLLKAPS